MNNSKTKTLTTIAMLCAVSYVVMALGRIPMVLFLKYDPKDVIITIGGFIYGPLTAAIISAVVSLVEMVTVSGTGFYGLIMNIISTCAFACTASFIYNKRRTLPVAVIALIVSCLFMTGVMLLWNYYITPLYMGTTKEAVAAMLIPYFLPFNLIKGALNAALTILIYKPVVKGLRRANLVSASTSANQNKPKYLSIGTALVAIFAIICLIMIALLIW